nr:hypothetical protein BaRGS_020126 [Batillaria attramentaria]
MSSGPEGQVRHERRFDGSSNCFRRRRKESIKFKDKERILAERRSLRDNESDVFISEDFTPREAKDANKRAFLRFDTLVIEGKSYIFDAATNGLVERRGRR